jgi:hypothetical protein
VQLTVRLPRWLVTALAIVVAAVGVATVLPATAESDSSIVVCIDPVTKDLTVDPTCTGSTLTWSQQGVAGAAGPAGAAGATGPAGPKGDTGPPVRLATSHPTLTARLEASLEVESTTITDVNHDLRASLALSNAVLPSTDPTIAGLQNAVKVQGTSIGRLLNVLRDLAKTQGQLLRGLE